MEMEDLGSLVELIGKTVVDGLLNSRLVGCLAGTVRRVRRGRRPCCRKRRILSSDVGFVQLSSLSRCW